MADTSLQNTKSRRQENKYGDGPLILNGYGIFSNLYLQ